jgi:DNA invertase Pin-like site-specific DNA recombinase
MGTLTSDVKTTPAARKRGNLFGYAWVSTTDQDLALQREALEGAGVNTVIARELGMARSSVYRLLREAGTTRASQTRSPQPRAA